VNAAREIVPLLLAFALLRGSGRRNWAAAGLVALLLISVSPRRGALVPTVDRRAFQPPIAGLQVVRAARRRIAWSPSPRSSRRHRGDYGLEDVAATSDDTSRGWPRRSRSGPVPQPVWSNRVDDLAAPMLSAMNVRYAIVRPPSRAAVVDGALFATPRTPSRDSRALPGLRPRAVHAGRATSWRNARLQRLRGGVVARTGGPAVASPTAPAQSPCTKTGRICDARLHARRGVGGGVRTAWRGAVLDNGHSRHIHFANRAFTASIFPPASRHRHGIPSAAFSAAASFTPRVIVLRDGLPKTPLLLLPQMR